jgi:hypothetical protein
MTTKVNEVIEQPAITMDKIHIDSFSFRQKRVNNPNREISMGFCFYGFDEDGNKHFEEKLRDVNDGDMDGTVVSAAAAAGQTVNEFMSEYSAYKSAITTEYLAGNISDAEIMAIFELALARIAELNGKISIAGIE